MRGLAVLTVVLVFASTALFVEPVSAQGAASLSGTVCLSPYGTDASYSNSTNGVCLYAQPLPGATITLTRSGTLPSPVPAPLGPSTATATSDANGQYSFSGLSAGDYAYSVARQGFKTATGTVSVAEGARQDLMLSGDIVDAKGTVRGPDGVLSGATVHLCCGEGGLRSGTTGSDGRYSISVQAGYLSVDVSASGHQTSSQWLLVDGSAIDVQLEKIPPQDGRVAGRVVDQDGKPVEGARVGLSSYGSCCYAYDAYPAEMSYRPYYGGENVTYTDADGRYSMGAYSGENGLSVSKDGYAYRGRSLSVAPEGTTTADVELLKYPEKTAKITGQIVDAKTGKGLANAYVNVQSPEYGLYECSQPASSGSGGGSSGSAGASEPGVAKLSIAPDEGYYDPGCAIVTDGDGNFEGMVTPGYAIVSVYVDHWSSCADSSDGDGSFMRSCGPEYYSWTRSLVLADDDTTDVDVALRSRPAPDAEVSGYILDSETGEAIPGASISFSNQDTYGWGSATTDADGSYRLRLRSGYHSVSVWAEGHLRWEGVVDIAKGDTPLDVEVVPGEESNGGCCWGPYYAKGGSAVAEDSAVAMTSTGAPAPSRMASGDDGSSSDAEQYEDLGGGLGPYDAEARAEELEGASNGSPGVGLLALLAAIGAVLVLRRRLA